MRLLAFAIAVTSSTPALADDGYYLAGSIGGAGYHGGLGRYDGASRWQMGIGIRHDDWSIEAFGLAMMSDLFVTDCYDDECAAGTAPQADLAAGGIDARKRWQLLHLRRWGRPGTYERPGVFAAVHAGPRWFVANGALDGYRGPGIGGGATLEVDLWVIGYYVDVGIDLMRLSREGKAIQGSAPYIAVGVQFGWL
ncbi:MAG: hypothetical protein ABI678_15470 [Kofleriaceae bacterium]